MSLTQAQMLDALGVTILALSGLAPEDGQVREGQQDVPRAPASHFRLTILSDGGIGRAYRVDSTTLQQHRQATVQIDAIGADVQVPALRVHALMKGDHPAMRTLRTTGVSVQGLTPATNASAVLQTSQEKRLLWTVTLGYVLELAGASAAEPATSIVLSVRGEPSTGAALVADDVATVEIP